MHGHEKSFLCTTCHKEFATRRDLARHKLRENTQGAYERDVCGVKIKEKIDLKAHLDTHSGCKKYTCRECGKRYRHRSRLSKHKTVLFSHDSSYK